MEKKDLITGNVKITIGGRPLTIELTVPVNPVKSRRMLPVFQGMSDLFAEIGEKEVSTDGKKISCQKGCAACCRQLIPLAEIETHHVAELVKSMPEPQRAEIKKRFKAAWQHFTEIGWVDRLDASGVASHEERQSIAVEYFHENVACPFLEDEACLIHENRPLACREYLVTSPAEYCFALNGKKIKMVSLPAKPSETVRQITNSENLNRIVNFVPLVLALEWATRFPDCSPENTGEQWMAKFFTSLTKSEIPKA
ncbi:MAG TPA: YkgJ family cysteine cluster protein [Pyrinomonadaceae bacterium]